MKKLALVLALGLAVAACAGSQEVSETFSEVSFAAPLDSAPTVTAPKDAPLGDGELILVVEDNDIVRQATVSRLQSLGYAALEAKTGPEAITLARVRRAH